MSTTFDARKTTPSVILAIGGSDSGGSAGIQADLKTYAARGVYGTTALTVVTAQDTQAVYQAQPLPETLIQAQIEAVLEDMQVAAVKTGLLGRPSVIELVAALLKKYAIKTLVVDPVLVNGKGERIVAPEAIHAYQQQLLPLATIITPNLDEAQILADMEITSLDDMKLAAQKLHQLGAAGVVIKGGHLLADSVITDLFYDGLVMYPLTVPRLPVANPHGVGCTFASAIAAELARGHVPLEAVKHAHAYLHRALAASWPVGKGRVPVHHGVDNWEQKSRDA